MSDYYYSDKMEIDVTEELENIEKTLVDMEREKLPNKIPLGCSKCGHRWKYSGSNPFYAQCPRCKKQLHIPDHRIDIPVVEDIKQVTFKDIKELDKDKGDKIVIDVENEPKITIEKVDREIENLLNGRVIKKTREAYKISREKTKKSCLIVNMTISEEDLKTLFKISELENLSFQEYIIKIMTLNSEEEFKDFFRKIDNIEKNIKDLNSYDGE